MEQMIYCYQCKEKFVYTQEEKMMYSQWGYAHVPYRCPVCRGTAQAKAAAVKPAKQMYTAVCDACGKETELPFQPKGDKPVYCRACFAARLEKKSEDS